MTRNARMLVAIGVGWIVSLFFRDKLTGVQDLVVLVVAAACVYALTAPLAKPEAERPPSTTSVRILGLLAGLALVGGLVLISLKQPEAAILAALLGLGLGLGWALLSWRGNRAAPPA